MTIPARTLNSAGELRGITAYADHAWQMALQFQTERDLAEDTARLGDVTAQRLDWQIDEHLEGGER